MNRVCGKCKSTEFVRDHANANNDLVCVGCGVVFEDNPIVSEVTFGESAAGAAVVHGSFVRADQAASTGRGALASRETTLLHARRRIRAVAHALAIPEHVTDAAFQWYKLALAHGFVRGRRAQNVVAACLYVACRKERTPHMLVDFSARLQVSVYAVGATFLQLVRKLHVQDLPLADPSIFIQHFTERLALGSRQVRVARDAVRLAQRMARDGMQDGRRPAGVAGACVLLACRMNNLRRTHAEIAAVSHVAEETLQQRLGEFRATGAAKMSVAGFRASTSDTREDSDTDEPGSASHNAIQSDPAPPDALPPSFSRNRARERHTRVKLQQLERDETSDDALLRHPILAQILGDQAVSGDEILSYVRTLSARRREDRARVRATHGIDDADVMKDDEIGEKEGTSESDESQGRAPRDGNDPYRPRNLHLLPTTASLLEKISDDPEDLGDVDDEELDSQLLDEESSAAKERVWLHLNADYLLEQENKRLKQEADEAAGNTAHVRKKRTRQVAKIEPHDGLQIEPDTAADSVKSMLQKASFSKKINYDAIDGLFK
ncbi:hypothetical protein TBLA_0B08030 [Henningerozyma blattae CBS 6284]|uniref:Transcription factor IIIB 70 kDa subunit n=1 Tax=Henningerozyma blattae (strain ATCC 34711 / CBS 6284 / DSM 70876 / NBRC 10599 / NRRL Y-10934 / UCD 77-7) TaxID=1071380 RepID=I2GZR7_HENB6|nr:hypothetical protein TBLA_0B08030 [Tetrapisispora blattae CBS 6284]CCH59619.1 hypothetical protein TBLA_0B08030 [Tetrapisispora blattae CBS 6284]